MEIKKKQKKKQMTQTYVNSYQNIVFVSLFLISLNNLKDLQSPKSNTALNILKNKCSSYNMAPVIVHTHTHTHTHTHNLEDKLRPPLNCWFCRFNKSFPNKILLA